MPTLAQERQMQNVLAEKIASGNPTLQKEAAASLDKFIRKSFKEQSYSDKILEPQQLTTDDFYPHMTSDKLWVSNRNVPAWSRWRTTRPLRS